MSSLPKAGRRCPRCGAAPVLEAPGHRVLGLQAYGLTHRAIAGRLGWSSDTVGALAGQARQQLGAATAVQAVDIACRTGLLVPPPGDPLVAARVTGGQLTAFEPITRGLSHQECAKVLRVGTATVGSHLRLLYHRIGARTAAHAAYLLHGLRRLPSGHPCRCPGRGTADAPAVTAPAAGLASVGR
ncbi:hypothetical protein ACIF6L_34615 [Kitasatospora sp. NPDC086009]|uniref:hypothetical protein n=1 Tax=unclassified Kitasatospora TaxID=2633591 RepID=UPI0037C7EBB3